MRSVNEVQTRNVLAVKADGIAVNYSLFFFNFEQSHRKEICKKIGSNCRIVKINFLTLKKLFIFLNFYLF